MLESYPYGMGEPFFHEELRHLAKKFDEVVLITKHSSSAPLFELPEGVQLIRLHKTMPTWSGKLAILLQTFLTSFFKETRRDLGVQGTKMNLLTFKTALAYKEEAARIGKELIGILVAEGRNPKDYIWYSYWATTEAYMLSTWKVQGRISFFYSRVHGADVYAERHPHNYLPFREFIFSQTNGLACVSDHGRRYLWQHYPRYSDRYMVQRLGVAAQQPLALQFHTTKKILSLSSIVPVKNLESLIQALALWEGETIEWHHIGSGAGSAYENEIYRLAESLLSGKTNVNFHFHGFLKLQDVLLRIQDINPYVLVNVSHFEGIPVSMMECASFGIPIIGPAVCGVPEVVIDGFNGYTFSESTPEGILKVIEKLLALDEAEIKTMRAASVTVRDSRFNANENYKQFAQVLSGNEISIPAAKWAADGQVDVGIVQTGLGNVAAVRNMLSSAGIRSEAFSNPELLSKFRTVILPGVGAFDEGMRRLTDAGFVEPLQNYAKHGNRLIGICLGMQLLFESSEEGQREGLSIIKGKVVRFPSITGDGRPIVAPHMGWNETQCKSSSTEPFWNKPMRFYFTHSFHAIPKDPNSILLSAINGIPFVAAVQSENVMGFQFHPEKSHIYGKKLLAHVVTSTNTIPTNA
jgi:glutamine amidotransferase